VEELASTCHPCRCRGIGIEEPELNEHRCLVPVEVFVRDLVLSEVDDADDRDFDPLACRRNAWQHPLHGYAVGELVDCLFNQPIVANGLRYQNGLHVGWYLWDEVVRVKLAHLVLAHPTGEHGDEKDMGILGHRLERVFNMFRHKLGEHMSVPEITHGLLGSREARRSLLVYTFLPLVCYPSSSPKRQSQV